MMQHLQYIKADMTGFDQDGEIQKGLIYRYTDKKNMFALLGKPGFEDLAKELNERL